MKRSSPDRPASSRRSAAKRARTASGPAPAPAAIPLEAHYRILFDTMSQGVIFRDGDGRIISANPAAERILGRPLADLLGKTSAEVHGQAVKDDGSSLPADAFPADVALRTGKPVSGFVLGTLNPVESTYRWIKINAMPILPPGRDRPSLVYVLFDDITEQRRTDLELQRTHDHLEQEVQERTRELAGTNDELTAQIAMRKETEAALRESEERFRRLAENAADLIYVYRLHPEKKFEYVSPSATDITGYSPQEHYANPDLGYQLVHAEDRHKLKDLVAGPIDPRRPLVLRWVRKDGRVIWTEQRNIPVLDDTGRTVAIQGIARDISDRISAEEKLRESEKFLQTVIETEPECVKMLSADGTLLMMNRAGLAMIEADSLAQVQGKTAGPLVAPEHRRAFSELLAAVFRGESGTLAFEMVGLKGRRLWMDTHMVPLRDDQGRIIAALGITRDITERKRAEGLLQTIAERVSQKTGMDFFRSLVSFIAAELGLDHAFVGRLMEPGTAVRTVAVHARGVFGENFTYDLADTPCAGVVSKGPCLYPDGIQSLFPRDRLLADLGCRSYAGIPLFAEDGKPIGILVALGASPLPADNRDRVITLLQLFAGRTAAELERQRSEEALLASERRYKQLLESITSYIYTVTVENGRAVSTAHGPGCAAVTGYTAAEYEADPFLWYRMVHDEDKPRVLQQAAAVLAGGQPEPVEHRLRHKNGSVVWIRSAVVPHTDEQGRLLSYDGLITDITAQKRAETLTRNILENVDEGFLIIDRDLTVLSANKAYAQLVGRSVQDIIGRKCYAVSHQSSWPCHDRGEDCAVREVFASESPHTAVHIHQAPDGGSLYVETKAFPLRDDDGRVVAAIEIIQNVTDRKRLEDQLRHSQKMEAVGLLAGGISHDFNNILTAIIGYGNLLKMKIPDADPLHSYVEQILASSARAANLTQSLLAFSRKQVINPRPMDLNDAIRRFEKLLLRLIGEDVDLQVALAPGEMTVLADSSQVEQVLMNLVTNARDAMPRGGTLLVRTEAATIDESFRRTHGFGRPGCYALVSIRDTGSGMDEATKARIFEPFFTTKDLGRGTGLGLAIVYGIMKQNNGYVIAESEPGRGSCFSLYFPLIALSAEAPAAAEAVPVEAGHETILVAEDDRTIRELTRTVLSEFGYHVIEAVDGEEAVRKFREAGDAVRLVILDVVMPKMTGKEAHDRIAAIDPAVKFLYISGYSADVLNTKGVERTDTFILKPVSPMDLLRTVRRVLDGIR